MRGLFEKKKKRSARGDADIGAPVPPVTSTTVPPKTFPAGIKVLHASDGSVVDIVFVHGLTGDRERTWQAEGAAAPWPQTLLHTRLPPARILTYGYDAYIARWEGMVSRNRIGEHATNLLTALATHREDDDTNERPIIFVCHSLGGLVCEDALLTASQRPERHLKQILTLTRGIIFMGTPHSGSNLAACAERLAIVLNLVKQTNTRLLATLRPDSEVLERVQNSFHTMIRARSQDGFSPIEITYFYEELPWPGVGEIVPMHSAKFPGYIAIGIHADHKKMTQFAHIDDPGFVAVAGELRRWIKAIQKSTKSGAPQLEPTAGIHQRGSQYGNTTISGGTVFQGNFSIVNIPC